VRRFGEVRLSGCRGEHTGTAQSATKAARPDAEEVIGRSHLQQTGLVVAGALGRESKDFASSFCIPSEVAAVDRSITSSRAVTDSHFVIVIAWPSCTRYNCRGCHSSPPADLQSHSSTYNVGGCRVTVPGLRNESTPTAMQLVAGQVLVDDSFSGCRCTERAAVQLVRVVGT